MLQMPIHEAKAKLSSLIALVEKGEEVVLTRHGKRVVRLVAEEPQEAEAEREARWLALSARMQALRESVAPAVPGYSDLQSIIAASKAEQYGNSDRG